MPYDGAKLKIGRAHAHLGSFRKAESDFRKRNPLLVTVEHPAQLGDLPYDLWVARLRIEVPSFFPVIIGDALHNMRAALDLTASDVVRLNGQRFDDVYFPFAESAEALDRQIKNKNFNRAHPDMIAVLRSLKPYTKDSDWTLRAIHDLDVIDKHKSLLPAVSAGQKQPVQLITESGEETLPSFRTNLTQLDKRHVMVVAPKAQNFPVGAQVPADFMLTFELGPPFYGLPVEFILQALYFTAYRVVDTFAVRCSGQCFPAAPASLRIDGEICTIVPGPQISDLMAKLNELGGVEAL